MSLPFEILPKEEIVERLRALRHKGASGPRRLNEPTLAKVAAYMGISLSNIVRRAEAGDFGKARQRHFSKIFAMIDNGQLRWEEDPNNGRKALVIVSDKPTKMPPAYKVNLTATGPRLAPSRRAQPLRSMPQFGTLLTKS